MLAGRADGFDPSATLTAGIQARAKPLGSKRFDMVGIPSTLYFFLNTVQPPFDSELARRAVITALNRPYMAKLGKRALAPDCYLIPEGVAGHATASCPYGDPDDRGDLKAARQLVEESGTAGFPVVVWVEDGSRNGPTLATTRSFSTVSASTPAPRRWRRRRTGKSREDPDRSPNGVRQLVQRFPEPDRLYSVLDSRFIGPPGSPNAGHVNDLFIQQQLEKLSLVAAQDLGPAAGEWRDLEEYSARKAYLAVLGYQQVPKLISDRLDPSSAVIHPCLSDWSSWALR